MFGAKSSSPGLTNVVVVLNFQLYSSWNGNSGRATGSGSTYRTVLPIALLSGVIPYLLYCVLKVWDFEPFLQSSYEFSTHVDHF